MKFRNLKRNYIVYLRTLKGKPYIGETNGEYSPNDLLIIRAGVDGKNYRCCTKFWNGIQKYGWPAVKSKVLVEGLNEKQAKVLETYYIIKMDAVSNGYNMTRGAGFAIDYELMEELLTIDIDDEEKIKNLLEQLDDEPIIKKLPEDNKELVEFCKKNHIQGAKNIKKEIKKRGLIPTTFSHYLRPSSDPGLHRYDEEFRDLWLTPEKDCEGVVLGLF